VISPEDREKLNAAAVEVFGMMYFTPVELLPDLPARESWQVEDQYVKTSIGYSGPCRADLCFYFPRTLALSVAGGFLGTAEESITDQQLIDTMRESANMIVGNYLGRLDPEGACTLGIPVAEMENNFSPEVAPQGGDLLAFISDYGLLWVAYHA